jgi:hypothetical protein
MALSAETKIQILAVAFLLLVFIGALVSQLACTSTEPIQFTTTDPYTKGRVLG